MPFDRDPRVKLMTLREYRSADGKQYFKGWLGDAVVLVFKDEDTTPDYGSVAVWNAHVVPKKPKAQDGEFRTSRPSQKRPARRDAKQSGLPARAPIVDDEIGF